MKPNLAIPHVDRLVPVRFHAGFEEFSAMRRDRSISIGLTGAGQFRSDTASQAFLNAVKEATQVSHPHIARTLAIDEVGLRQWAVSWEKPAGTPLAEVLRARGTLLPDEAVNAVLLTAQALAAAHAIGIIHGNVGIDWITSMPGPVGSDVRLGGFGIALLPHFARGENASVAHDVAGLTTLLHQLATGLPPTAGELGSLPAPASHLLPFLKRGLGQSDSPKFQTVAQFVHALGESNRTHISGGDVKTMATLVGEASVPRSTLGQWELMQVVGEGAMGRVYVGRHKVLGRQAAIKVLRREQYGREDLVQRFFQEARAVSQINHDHIVEIFDFGEERDAQGMPSAFYFVMELLEGETLTHRLGRLGLSIERAVYVTRQIASALGAAHKLGVVHRDLKADNVFLTHWRDDREFVKVLDFGVAKLTHPTEGAPMVSTIEGAIVGTPVTMSPEQVAGDDVDHRTDVYSLGVLLYQMLSGTLPFEADSFVKLAGMVWTQPPKPLPQKTPQGEVIPADLLKLVMRCLEKDKTKRIQSMDEMLLALDALTGAAGNSSDRRLHSVSSQVKTSSRMKWFGPVIGAIAVVTFAALAVTMLSRKPDEPAPRVAPQVSSAVTPVEEKTEERHAGAAVSPPQVTAPQPSETLLPPQVQAPAPAPKKPVKLTQELLQSIVERHRGSVISCLERHRSELPSAAGTVRLRWTVEKTGAVTMPELADEGLKGKEIEPCLLKALGNFRFPKNEGPTRRMTVPFMYSGAP